MTDAAASRRNGRDRGRPHPGVNRRAFLGGAALAGAAALAPLRGPVALAGTATGPYDPTPASLNTHPVAPWYRDAKFGIFIHWGVYSVPAWGDTVDYHAAEWYFYAMRISAAGRDSTYQHHLSTYGPGVAYDDFIPRFTAERYDPHAWIRLFERAGARYFVLTSKHHDGFQLFPNAVSRRNAAVLGPHRDLVGELFAAARHSPLRRGLYYSLGEFYNPALGTPPWDPYTRAPIPYTGYTPVKDYVADYEHVHLRTLIDRYDPDLLWADGQNWHEDLGAGSIFCPKDLDWRSGEVLAYYYNRAVERRRDVMVNDRFRAGHADFAVSEGDKSSYKLRSTPWEACLTMGRSWGYDTHEDPARIKSEPALVQLLVDIVAKNGNLLLNIGPRHDGTIADWQRERLIAVGDWLRDNGSAIYGTTPWQRAQDGDLRYTVSPGAFNIIPLSWPGATLTVPGDLPVADGARMRLLGHHGRPLEWTRQDGSIVITLPSRAPGRGPDYPCVIAVH
ncbi:alpha-L-fucosidase [Actinoallomurus sp. NPDC050550]|uniref:alpha-L-fucosidase n=1 Tax=Actinoallomurus sp. NPDC050550 TaxID=3154937 RepID=UPI0034054A1D